MEQFLEYMQGAASNALTYGGTFLLVLSVLVFIHEWGHYIVARLCGVGVEVFSIGFGKELFGFTAKSGTRWKFSLIPLGGYVKMFGDADPASAGKTDEITLHDGSKRKFTQEDKKKAFFAKPVWQRALIVFAGPAINFLFAIVVLAILFSTYGRPVSPPVASGVKVGSAADSAGFQAGDRVISGNNQVFKSFDEIRRYVILSLDTPIEFKVIRNEKEITIKATATRVSETDRFGFSHEKGQLGLIGPGNGFELKRIVAVGGVSTNGDIENARALLAKRIGTSFSIDVRTSDKEKRVETFIISPPLESNKDLLDKSEFLVLADDREDIISFNLISGTIEAIKETGDVVRDTLFALGQMVMGTRSATELGGVIRIGAVAGDMAAQGFIAILTFTALLSINLGLINLFPIPMLDGGHLVFYAIEALKGGPISEKIQDYAFRVGFALLICLMLFANLNDLVQIIS